ncbi:MAG: SPOR domain-containing protein [Epsilonproteobacteria bacterium]|nr:MAG: SPOR domain-containing protein [Campylobacterota bacterium]
MDDRSELNDIILNKKNDNTPNRKKILLSVATFAIILIIVVIIMNLMNSSGTSNLPQATPTPEKKVAKPTIDDDIIFEEVEVIDDIKMEEKEDHSIDLKQVTQKIEQQIQQQEELEQEIVVVHENELDPIKSTPEILPPAPIKKSIASQAKTPSKQDAELGATYIQVGSFSKYTPNKSFLNNITRNGYNYAYHRVVRQGKILNKVIVGPFNNRSGAQNALKTIRKNITPDAFIISSLK